MSTVVSQPRSDVPRRIVLMGVAGCGKSAVGAALAASVLSISMATNRCWPRCSESGGESGAT